MLNLFLLLLSLILCIQITTHNCTGYFTAFSIGLYVIADI